MSNIKKIIGVLLALVMALSVVTVAFAEEVTPAFTVDVTTDAAGALEAGDEVNVTVKLTTTCNVSLFSIPVFYDATKLELKADTAETDVDIAEVAGNFSDYPAKLYEGTTYTPADHGVVAVVALAEVPSDVKQYNNETVLTFTLVAKEGAEGTDTIGCVEEQLKKSFAQDESLGSLYVGEYKGTLSGTKLSDKGTPIATATLNSAEVSFASAVVGPNTLVVKSDFVNADAVVVDTNAPSFFMEDEDTTGVIYGIETIGYYDGFETYYALADALTTSLGDEYLRITPSNEDEGYESTGTLVEVLDNDGETVLETYYFVYFGDVNGDGYIDNMDATLVATEALGPTLETVYELLAADYNGDTYADNMDATAIETVALDDAGYASQEEIAALFYESISAEY